MSDFSSFSNLAKGLKNLFNGESSVAESEAKQEDKEEAVANAFNTDNSYASVVPFINAYRDSLGRQRDLNRQSIDNNRRNQYQNVMGSANTLGMMYSNFPERAKMLYDTNTYMPALTENQTTYQTGLDKLRSNTVNYLRQLKDINEAIADLSTSTTSSSSGDSDYLKNLYEQLGKLYGADTE